MNQIFNALFVLLIPFALANLLWTGILIFLEKDAPGLREFHQKKEFSINVSLSKIMLPPIEHVKKPIQKVRINQMKMAGEKKSKSLNSIQNELKNLTLTGIYKEQKNSFIVINNNGKSLFLSEGDKFKGFIVEIIGNGKIRFSKGSENIEISMDTKKLKDQKAVQKKDRNIDFSRTNHKIPDKFRQTRKETLKTDEWIHDIGISALRDANMHGVRVDFVRRKSPFERMGIKEGDIIKAINGIDVQNRHQVHELLSTLKPPASLSISILREDEEKEFIYDFY